ncbi:MAG: glycosyltransferase family 39 protein [bacterium]
MLIITLSILGILLVALLAHASGSRVSFEPHALARALDSRAALVFVFVSTLCVLWFSWAAWNPKPVVHDEMAYVFQAQVFARGMWALPAPQFPAFWEQPHFLIEPTVTIKYFPGHPLVLALGALVGWMALMPLVLQSTIAVLAFVLARRLSSGAVALLAWVIWLFTPMVTFFGPTFFSEATTTLCWLAGWYALVEWRSTRKLHWLLAVALFTGWDAITRPLTGLAYAIPIGIVVLHDVIAERRWRDFAFATLVGVAVLSILPLWSMHTTGDWRVTPLALYTRLYMPYDVPGFGLIATAPTHAMTQQMREWNDIYSSVHVTHLLRNLPAIFRDRAIYLFVSTWGLTSGLLGVFAVLGILTARKEVAFAAMSCVLLIVVYLAYATPAQWTLYYYETTPTFTYLSAAGLAWAASMIGRPTRVPASASFAWRSPRWTLALVAGSVVFALPGSMALRITRARHVSDGIALNRFDRLLSTIHDPKAVVFVRYSPTHSTHVTFVRNVANPTAERIWVVYDRGEAENARFRAAVPERRAYLFDETRGRTYVYEPDVTRAPAPRTD